MVQGRAGNKGKRRILWGDSDSLKQTNGNSQFILPTHPQKAMVFSGVEVFSKEIPETESPLRDPESSGLRLFSCITSSSIDSFFPLLLQIVSKDGMSYILLQSALPLLHQEVEESIFLPSNLRWP